MSNKKTNAAKIGKNMNRRERWHAHIKARLAEVDGNDAYIPAEWLAEIEGRPMDEVILDRLANRRGLGVTDPTPEQEYNFSVDEGYERESAQRRNNHEKGCVSMEVSDFMLAMGGIIPREGLHDFVRRFYHAGDRGLHAAIRRAVRDAVEYERSTSGATEPRPTSDGEQATHEQVEAAVLHTACVLRDAIETRAETPSEKKSRNEAIVKCLDALANARTAFATVNA